MRAIRSLAIGAVAVLALIAAAYLVFHAIAAWQQGYSWAEMDWDANGRTSIGEFFESSEIGKRNKARPGLRCVEYFSYKNGIPVKERCTPYREGD